MSLMQDVSDLTAPRFDDDSRCNDLRFNDSRFNDSRFTRSKNTEQTFTQHHATEHLRQRSSGNVHRRVLIKPDGTYYEETKTHYETELERKREIMVKKVEIKYRSQCRMEIEGTVNGKLLSIDQSKLLGMKDVQPFGKQTDLRRIWFQKLKDSKASVKEELSELEQHLKVAFASRFRFAQEQLLKQQLESELDIKKSPKYVLDVARRDIESRMGRMIKANTFPGTWKVMDFEAMNRTLTIDEEVEEEGLMDPELYAQRKEELVQNKFHRPKSALFMKVTILDELNRFPLTELEFRPYLVYAIMSSKQKQKARLALDKFSQESEVPPSEYPAGWMTSQELVSKLTSVYDQLEKRKWQAPTFEDQTLTDQEIFEKCMKNGDNSPQEAVKMYKQLMSQKKDDITSLFAEARHLIMFVDKAGSLVEDYIPKSLVDPIRRYLSRIPPDSVCKPNADFYPVKLKSEC